MKISPLILLTGGIALYFLRNQLRSAQNVSFQLDTIGLTNVSTRSINGYIKIKLFNPDAGKINVRQIAGTLSIDGSNSVNFSSQNTIVMEPKSNVTAVINFEISIAGLALQALPIVKKIIAGQSLNIDVVGFIDTNVGRVNFNKLFTTK